MKILITGGCGFIGSNLVRRLAPKHQVIVMDNLSRNGTSDNLSYLIRNHIADYRIADITTYDFNQLPEVDAIYHMAAQVGVQKSINDPMYDFNQNILGTLKVLEYARRHTKKPTVVYASTNKVYGELKVESPVDERTPIDFHTPYGVSKGAADQYVLDYNRIYGVPGFVFRQSCIYGDFQKGSEEQGWVCWFLVADKNKEPLTIYGDGEQRRDVLYIDDLVDLYEEALQRPDLAGVAYNVGGGCGNTLSLNELVSKANITTQINFAPPRAADQKYYVSDITKVCRDFKWKPRVGVEEGLARLKAYVEQT